ncbi:MAG: diacylglycerol kinase family protein [Candidatus Moraniibacteriota bacterium]|jgi:diacylglycerol kinase|nr:MAG: diacylglycerol kinase family protein [Candidatus Moranbacteria bacterium]
MTLVKSFLRSLRHAFAGIVYAFREERNFQIELVLGLAALGLTFFFPLSPAERSIIFLLIGFILTLELVNTAFERLLDLLKPRVHPYVKVVKDVVAGAVLIGSVAALLVGAFIFLPYLMTWAMYQ